MFNQTVFNNPGQQFSPLDQQADNYPFKAPGDHSSQQFPGKSKEMKLNHSSGKDPTDEDEVGEDSGTITRKINMVSLDLKTLRNKMNLLYLPSASLTSYHIEHFKALCIDILRLLRPIILSDMSSEKTNWALQQEAYVEECMKPFWMLNKTLKKKRGKK